MASIGESGHASAGLATAAFQSHLAPAPVPDREELFFTVSPAASTKESWVERAANLTADDFRALADALPQPRTADCKNP